MKGKGGAGGGKNPKPTQFFVGGRVWPSLEEKKWGRKEAPGTLGSNRLPGMGSQLDKGGWRHYLYS